MGIFPTEIPPKHLNWVQPRAVSGHVEQNQTPSSCGTDALLRFIILVSVISGEMQDSFVHDGDGQRVAFVIAGEATVYIGEVFEWQVTSSSMRRYYYAGVQRSPTSWRAIRTGSASSVWLLGDHLGSTSVAANMDGSLLSRQGYLPWGELRFAEGSLPGRYKFTGQASYEAEFGLYYYKARWYDAHLGRFSQPDSIVPDPGNSLDWDRYAYSYGNPVKYIDPDGHWPCSFSSSGFSCSVSTFGLGAAINRVGDLWGVKNASDIVSGVLSNIGLGLDITAVALDFTATAIVTTGIVVGATSGAVITLPGGGTAVVSGAAGASVGWATAELGVIPIILAGNALASLATLATVSSELISGDTGFESALGISSEGVDMSSQVTIGSASQVSTWATMAGWISPLAYPSLGIQTVAILGDLGVVSPPPISIGLAASFPKEPIAEFSLKFGDVEVR